MNKPILYILVALVVLVSGFFALNNYRGNENEKQTVTAVDHKDAEYVVDGQRIKLTDGVSEVEAAPGSASKIVTRYFGNEIRKDLNADSKDDVVFLLTQERGGSGTFFYVVAALNTENGYVGSEGLLLGDRIAPQTTENGRGKIVVVNYVDRAAGEDFSVQPSVSKSLWLLLDEGTMQFGEVARDFEGEADPSRMTLSMKTWNWVKTTLNDGTEKVPRTERVFSVTFDNVGRFSAKTDCNVVSGEYAERGTTLLFSKMISTKMYCEGSQESEFTKMLADTESFFFTSRGEFVLNLKSNGGSVIFR